MITPERWRALSPLLDSALELPPEQRAAWLAALRSEQPGLASDVEVLLNRHAALSREGFLGKDSAPPTPTASLAGVTLGAYTLRTLIGQGGYGSVWLADRTDGRFEGVAAVKLLNVSLIGHTGETRFRREGSLLARLRHPHIAHLIDAGVSQAGQPYLILEHVAGEHIDRYCDAHSLGIDARIRLFLDVLSAVAFAHANLVVHRDLKPPNVLVGAGGQVKLLDFGIAKLLESDTGQGPATQLTREGAAAMTPEYAAPEQLTGEPITTATDVYALGVILYVLLTGQHPVGAGSRSPAELIKLVVEGEPPRPSDVVAPRLRHQLQGDLDNIVAMALKKRPSERYASVGAMADDLRRYLDHLPVSARADSFAYRAAKFVRRNRGLVAVTSLAVVAVLGGTAGVAWQAREASIQRDAAQAQLARATATAEFTGFLLSAGAPAGKPYSASELLAQGEALIDKQFAGNDAMQAEMLAAVGGQYVVSERWDKATPVLERAYQLAGRSGDPALKARAACPLALLRMMNGQRAEAEALMRQALEELPREPQFALQRAECFVRSAEFSFFTDDAEAMIRNASAALEQLDSIPITTSPKRIDAEAALAYGYYLGRQYTKADASFARVMSALERVGRDRTLAASDTLNNWALVHYLGDIARAEPLIRRAVDLRRSIEGADAIHPTATHNHAGALLALARYDEAGALLEETVRTATARGELRIQFDAMMELSLVHLEQGDLPRAAAQLQKMEQFKDNPRFDVNRRAGLNYYWGRLELVRGGHAAARKRFADAVAYFDAQKWKIGMSALSVMGLARAQVGQGDTVSAEETARRALALAQSFVEPDSPSYLVGHALVTLGEVDEAAGRNAEARQVFEKARLHLEQTLGPDHPASRSVRDKLGS